MGQVNTININDSVLGRKLMMGTYRNIIPLCIEFSGHDNKYHITKWVTNSLGIATLKCFKIKVTNLHFIITDINYSKNNEYNDDITLTCKLLSNPHIEDLLIPNYQSDWKQGNIQDMKINFLDLTYEISLQEFFHQERGNFLLHNINKYTNDINEIGNLLFSCNTQYLQHIIN